MPSNVTQKTQPQIAPEALTVSGGAQVDKIHSVRPAEAKSRSGSFERHLFPSAGSDTKQKLSSSDSRLDQPQSKVDSKVESKSRSPERPIQRNDAVAQRTSTERRETDRASSEPERAAKPADKTQLPTVRSSAKSPESIPANEVGSESSVQSPEQQKTGSIKSSAGNSQATEVSSAELNQLKAIFLKNGAPTTKAPVLALLNGNIELLEPGQIPELVTSNPFLSEAFSQVELGGFINQSTELGEIIRDIDPSREVLEEIQRTGIDLSQMTTPRQFFDAIGLDANRVSMELKQLKSSLQMSDGLASYMIRAAKIRSQLGMSSTGETDAVVRRADQQVFDKPVSNDIQSFGNSASPNARESRISSGEMPFPKANPQTSSPVMTDSSEGQKPRQSKLGIATDSATDGFNIKAESAIDALTLTPVEHAQIPNSQLASTDKFGEVVPSPDQSAVVSHQGLPKIQQQDLVTNQDSRAIQTDLPKLRLAQTDPFEKLNAADTGIQSVAGDLGPMMDKVATDSSEEESAGLEVDDAVPTEFLSVASEKESSALSFQPEDAAVSGLDHATNIFSPTEVTDGLVNDAKHISEKIESREAHSSGRNDFLTSFGQGLDSHSEPSGPSLEKNSDRAIDVSQLIEQISKDAIVSDRSTGRDDGSRRGGSEAETGQREPKQAQRIESAGTSAVFDLRREFEVTKNAEVSTEQITKKVIEKAEIMLRDGGGSVKLEVETKDFGKVDVALKLDGDRLELKLLTNSEAARELVHQNLSKLKEQLALQNFQLERADVGLSMSMNQRGDGSQSMTFDQRNGQNGFINTGAPRDSGKLIPMPQRVKYQPNPYHSGRIQIAV